MAMRFPDTPTQSISFENQLEELNSSPINAALSLRTPIERPNSSTLKTVKHGNLRVAPDGTMTFKKTESDVLMAAIQLGISHSLAKLHPKPKRDLLVPDFRSVDNMEFPAAGSDITPGHTYSDFNFKAYSPIAFRHLRDHFTIAPEDFLSSLCYFPLRAIGNPGASGSLFYVSQDDLFIIKTVSSKEALFLQKLLPGYWINLHQNKRTLLPKFFGLYSYNKKGTRKIRLVVMNNLLPSNIEFHLKFDLKGSLHGRNASTRELSKNHPTFKDNDFLTRLENGIVISPEKYELLSETIQRDCQVLESFAIMDYSLLVAVHNITKHKSQFISPTTDVISLPAEQRSTAALRLSMSLDETDLMDQKSFAFVPSSLIDTQTHDYIKSLPEGYFFARLPNQDLAAVYLGIIDILQSYVTIKKLEHTFKSIVYDGDTVSVHKPSFYSKRFQNFMYTNVFTKDPSVRDSKTVSIPLSGARRKNKRSSIGSRPVMMRSQSNEYNMTPPSYQLENDQTDSSKLPNLSTNDYSLRIPNEDELIRYSQLELEQETPQKDLFQSSEIEKCDQITKYQDSTALSTQTYSSLGGIFLKTV